jgi:hypothetical protein
MHAPPPTPMPSQPIIPRQGPPIMNPPPSMPPQPRVAPMQPHAPPRNVQPPEPQVELAMRLNQLPESARGRRFVCGYCGWDLTTKYYETTYCTVDGQYSVIVCPNCWRPVTQPIPVEMRMRSVLSR